MKFLALLRKDWRLNRIPVSALLFAALAPYIMASLKDFWSIDYTRSLKDVVFAGSSSGVICASLIAVLFAANAFTADRREGSADFLGTLPASRRIIILSKLTIAAGCPLAVGLIHGILWYWTGKESDNVDYASIAFAAFAFAAFGIAWLCSTFLQSPSNAVACCLFSMVFLFIICGFVHADGEFAAISAFGIGFVTGITGCVYYARRVAP